MSRRVGLDAGSREVLLDLIYRLSLDDKASDREARAPRDGTAKERHRKERPAGDDEDDEARLLRARAKEARREEREREKKEKVLHKALKEDRRAERRDKASGGVGPDDDDDSNRHPHLLDRPKPAGEKIAVTATCASGETKLLQIARADDLESLFKAARSKFKAMKKAPNTARLHAPPGPAIEDSRSLAPNAVVFVDFDETKDAAKKHARRKPRAAVFANALAAVNKREDDASAETVAEISAGDTPRVDANDMATDADTTEDVAPSLPGASSTTSSPEEKEKEKAVAAENARLLAAVMHKKDSSQKDTLPAHGARDALLRVIEESGSPVTVLTGETGSGKTTCVPLFVLEHYAANARGAEANVLVAQPRRVAAVSVARRVAEVFGESVGHTVGYAVRGDSRVCSRRTRLTFLTTGALLRRLAADPELRGVSHVFVDEIHERTADADFLLAHLRNLLVTLWFSPNARVTGHTELVSGANGRTATDSDRNEPTVSQSEGSRARASSPTPLRVVLMSATMASSDLRDYFASAFPPSAPPIPTPHIEGHAFPVEERFAETYVSAYAPNGSKARQKQKRENKNTSNRPDDAFDAYSSALVASLPPVLAELENVAGASALVFLPGAPEIARLQQTLRASLPGALMARLHVVPLHGQLSGEEQRRAFDPAPFGTTKLVLATNVAETSLTIPDVVAVFDSGRSKKLAFDEKTQLSALRLGWCSLASAAQRKGRAGRVRPGVCVRLYTAAESAANQPERDAPELQTAPLESLVMHAMLTSPARDPEAALAATPDPPSREAVRAATRRLRAVGALAPAPALQPEPDPGRSRVPAKTTETTETSPDRPKLVLTPLGAHLAQLPVEPRLGKMLVYACVLGCLPPILTAAAAMSCKPAFRANPDDKDAAVAAKRAASAAGNFGARSDHLAVAAAFDAWERDASAPGVRALCLSRDAMRDIKRERETLKQKLRESGFRVDAPSARANQANDDIARCVLAAGLFPNVARVRRGELRSGGARQSRRAGGSNGGAASRGRAVVLDARGAEVAVHPGGVNGYQGAAGGPPEGFLVYQEAVETSRVFLRDTTAVPVEALLLFGGDISVNHAAATVSVEALGVEGPTSATSGRVEAPAAPEVGVLFKLLRRELDRALRVAAADPGAEQASLQGTPEGRRLMDVLLRLFPGGSVR